MACTQVKGQQSSSHEVVMALKCGLVSRENAGGHVRLPFGERVVGVSV